MDAVLPLAALALAAEHSLSNELLETVPRLNAVNVNGFIGPLARQPKLTPLGDRLGAAITSTGQDRIELVETNFFQRIFFVHEESNCVEESKMPIGPAANRNAARLRAGPGLGIGNVIRVQLARHKHKVQIPFHQFFRPKAAGLRRWRTYVPVGRI